ncbi:uncharacterized protein LOC143198768 [Rhynchophorus ferrugineus]|uniref:uncharacterized protein LOC143198768 n=1 Tax=Rhynchophorus ferrugineus TaxID=354439 RepID=UPI003FCCBE77
MNVRTDTNPFIGLQESQTPPPSQEYLEENITAYALKEKVTVKPSIELIPDVYERANNEDFWVQLVYKEEHQASTDLLDVFRSKGFGVLPVICLQYPLEIEDTVRTLREEINKRNTCEGLLMIFTGMYLHHAVMTSVWTEFITMYCHRLKNKPRVFIFQREPTAVQHDGSLRSKKAYESPAEADILIALNTSDVDMFPTLTKCINDYGDQEDIASLLTMCINHHDSVSLVSTMTRKLYLTCPSGKSLQQSILEKLDNMENCIEDIKKRVRATDQL